VTKPFEPVRDYVKVHRAIYSLYTQIPGFKSDHALLYVYLMDRYNLDHGYAYPDTWNIALALNCGESKVSAIKTVLIDCGLIETMRHPAHGNDVYFVKAPITEAAEFYARFPEARAAYEERKATFDKRRQSGSERKRAFDERVRTQSGTAEARTEPIVDESVRVIMDWF
jgi:hypothetical protein